MLGDTVQHAECFKYCHYDMDSVTFGVRQLVRSKIYRFIFMAFFTQVKKRCQEANEHSDSEEQILTFSCQTKISQKSV